MTAWNKVAIGWASLQDWIIEWQGTAGADRFSLTNLAGRVMKRGDLDGDGMGDRNGDNVPDVFEPGASDSKLYQTAAFGSLAVDHIKGGDSQDYISGQGGADWLFGEGDNDLIAGGRGADHIYGGQGSDLIYCHLGNDVIEGGDGADKFVVRYMKNRTVEHKKAATIKDFDPGEDTIVFKAVDFDDLDVSQTGDGFTFVKGRDTLVHVETDASLPDVLGAFEFGGPSLAQMASDFLVVYEGA